MHTRTHSEISCWSGLPAVVRDLMQALCVFLMLQQRKRDERWGGGGGHEEQKAERKDVGVLKWPQLFNLKSYQKIWSFCLSLPLVPQPILSCKKKKKKITKIVAFAKWGSILKVHLCTLSTHKGVCTHKILICTIWGVQKRYFEGTAAVPTIGTAIVHFFSDWVFIPFQAVSVISFSLTC